MNGFVATPEATATVDNINTPAVAPTTDATQTLRNSVRQCLKEYMAKLEGQDPNNLWDLVCEEVERPLIRTVLEYTNFNQSKAAKWLGISRGTLRKKMAEYTIDRMD